MEGHQQDVSAPTIRMGTILIRTATLVTGLFLASSVAAQDDIMRQIVHRVRTFQELPRDVDLYLRLRKAVQAGST